MKFKDFIQLHMKSLFKTYAVIQLITFIASVLWIISGIEYDLWIILSCNSISLSTTLLYIVLGYLDMLGDEYEKKRLNK